MAEEEYEILPAAADEYEILPPDPMPPTDEGGGGDVGPPTSFDGPGRPESLARTPRALRQEMTKQEGWEDAIPFLRNLEAAMTMGLTDQTYDQAKAASVARRDALRDEFPAEYWNRNVTGSVGIGALANRAGGLKVLGVGPVDALAMYGQGENQGSGSFAGDVAAPTLAGPVVGGVVKGGGKLVWAIGKALGVPLQVAEELFARIGPSKLVKMIVGDDETPAGRIVSERAKALKANIDAADAFVPAEVPTIRPKTDRDFRALEIADLQDRGAAGSGDFFNDPSLIGNDYDDALRDAMRKHDTHFNENYDLLGEYERIKYPDAKPLSEVPGGLPSDLPESMAKAGADVPTKNAVVPAVENVPSGAGSFKSNKEAWDAITEASGGYDPRVQSRQAGHFDEVERILGRKVRDAKDAFDGLVKASALKRGRSRPPYDWEDVQTAVRVLRDVEGLERLRLPSDVQERLIPLEREASEVSFDPSKLDAQNAADADAAREAMNIKHKGEFRGPTGRAKDKPSLVEIPAEGEGSFIDDWGLKPANEADLVSGVNQRRVRLDDSALEEGLREESDLSRQYFERMDRSASGQAVESGAENAGSLNSTQRAELLNSINADTKAGMLRRREALLAKVKEYRELMAQADVIESQNRMEAAQLRGKADKAKAEAENIARGRRAAEKVAGAVSGWQVGSVGGVLGQIGGAAAGFKHGAPVGLGMEAASAAGQKLSAWAAANADRLATTGGELGNLARWALSGSGASQELRMYALGKLAQQMGQIETNEGTTLSP